jgi:thioredoxin 1
VAVTDVTSNTFRQHVLESPTPVVVDFYADWCGPCKQISPAVEALSEKWAEKVRFAKVDIDANKDVAQAYRISSIPAVLLFDAGEVRAWSIGVKPGYVIERELGLAKREKRERRVAGGGGGLLERVRSWWSTT